MAQQDPDKKDIKKNNEDAPVQPDPETLGPDPQEHMRGPISSIIRKIEESADEEDEKIEENQKDSSK
jgi:hypothetical protein